MATEDKKTIKVFFVDFWKGFDPENNFFVDRMKLYFQVQIEKQSPDFLFYSWNGYENLKYTNCVKLYFTGENDVPDFNLCDYAIGFHHITFADRYFRLPLFVLYKCFGQLPVNYADTLDKKVYLDRKFCSFVVSNSQAADPIRDEFFAALSKYKKVDSGGRHLNNIGYNVPDKQEFISKYKFNIAFENSMVPGYTTEKLHQPLAASTIPIYWGNPRVEDDFNKEAFVYVNDYATLDQAVAEIIRLDNDDEAYLKKLLQPSFTYGQRDMDAWLESFDNYIQQVFQNDVPDAKRLPMFGYSAFYRKRRKVVEFICRLPGLKYLIRKVSYNS
jgi:hypothetical protein